jgi:hypothetical protein
LIDRLLKPDTTLQNTAQNKKFEAGKTAANKQAHVETFYLQEKSKPKQFSGTRDYSASQFNARTYSQTRTANTSSRTTLPDTHYATSPVKVAADRDAAKKKDTRDYAGNRPFLDQGKSQKALSQKHPMTIEEVRELLNKNK